MSLTTDARLKAEGRLVGWTDPRPYDAGVFTPPGDTKGIPFEAGVSFRVCMAHGDKDFTVLQVKTSEVGKVRTVLESVPIGAPIAIEYSARNGKYQLHQVAALQPAK